MTLSGKTTTFYCGLCTALSSQHAAVPGKRLPTCQLWRGAAHTVPPGYARSSTPDNDEGLVATAQAAAPR